MLETRRENTKAKLQRRRRERKSDEVIRKWRQKEKIKREKCSDNGGFLRRGEEISESRTDDILMINYGNEKIQRAKNRGLYEQ